MRVPSAAAPVLNIREGQQPLNAPGYFAVAEASAAGTSLRPVFVGRSDGLGDPRWDAPLLTMGRGAAADIGAPVFTLDGRLAGLLTSSEGEAALVPAAVVLAPWTSCSGTGSRHRATSASSRSRWTRCWRPQLACSSGAAIAAVHADGPAAGSSFPGDVITAVNGQPVRYARRPAPARRAHARRHHDSR